MSDINKQMAEFAKELWENYIKPKVGIEFSDTVSYYMATVVSNDGYNRVTIKRPFDDAYQVSCLDDMAGLEAGDTVLVLRFGNGTNNANHIVFGKGNGNMNYTAAAATATATEASVAAGQAAEAAAEAIESASQAADAADAAQQSALEAQESAETANQAANNALIGLATVEGVVDTVNWFAEHKTASTDTSVVPSKTYYEYNPVAGTLSAVTPEGDENPSEEGWYELSEAISNYVATHIATTNDGLYVVGLSNGWKVLVSSGTGTYTAGIFLIDPSGNIAQATTANGITFDDSKPFYIGDNNASIVFDGNGHISISGIGVSIGSTGSKSIDEVLSELGASIKTIEYGVGNSATSHSDITSWSSNTPEWQEDKYIWQRTTTNGLTYTYTCIQGAAGAPGAPGVSVSGVTNYYLATSQSSGVTRETTGWTTSIQTMTSTNQYLWNYEVVTGSDGSTLNTTDPVIIGRYGQDGGSGRGITGITEYYLASNQQTGITPSSSGWTTTVQTTTTATPYLWNYEVVTYSSGSPETSSARIIGTHGETGTPGIDFSQGKMLYTDPSFKTGSNDVKVYNNSGGGTVTLTRSAKSSDNPMSDTSYELVITNTGTASPGIGGFFFGNASRANAIFVYRIIAKIPIGRSIKFASNPTGNYRAEEWLTSQAGTGKFTEYIFRLTCGADGTFATTGFFYIDGDPGTSSSPVNWYLAYATGFDMTNISDVQTAQATANSAEQKIDNLDVGGRNLILRTETMSGWYAGSAVAIANGVATFTGSSSTWNALLGSSKFDATLYDGTVKTLSFDYMCSTAISVVISYSASSTSVSSSSYARTRFTDVSLTLPSTGGAWKRYSCEPAFIAQSDLTGGSGDIVSGYIGIYVRTDTTAKMQLLKWENGNIATAWTPAPEDIQQEIDGISVGSRNLSVGTVTPQVLAPVSSKTYFSPLGFYPVGDYGVSLIRSASTEDEWVVSFNYSVTGATVATKLTLGFNRTATSFADIGTIIDIPVGDSSGYSSTVFKMTADQIAVGYKWLLGRYDSTDTAIRVTLSNFMFEKGNRATSWSPAPEDVQKEIDDIEIGGTNLIPYSINLKSFSKEASATVTYTTDSCTCLNTSSNTSAYGVYYDVNVTSGTQYTLSFYVSALSGTCMYAIGNRSASTPDWNGISDGYKDMLLGRNVFTFTVPSGCTLIRVYLTTRNNGSTWTVSRLKLERGNKATDWSPAPEDLEEAIEAVEETATEALNKHGFCSCSTAANTQAKTANLTGFQLKTGSTVHVTFTNANSVANPTLNINSTGAKTIRWNNANVTAATSPWAAGECVTFVYDGYYWVVSGQSNILADNIVAGSIAADRIKANVISAVNGGTGTINADKVNAAGLTIGQSQVTGLTTALNGKEATVTSTTPTYDTDQIPYMYRRSTKAIMGQESLDSIVGGTVAWNQIIKKNTTSWYAYRGTMSYSSTDNEYTVTFNGQGAGGLYNQAITDNIPQGHKVLILATVKASKSFNSFRIYCNNASKTYTSLTTSYTRYETILATNEPNELHFYVTTSPAPASGDVVNYKNIQLFDITLMFGTSIADYIYSLESATAGSGMAKLRQWGFFTNDVYEYAEETRSVTGLSSHDTVGKNLADLSEQTGGVLNGEALIVNGAANANYAAAHIPIKLFKGVTYTLSANVTSIRSGSTARISFRHRTDGTTYASSDAITSPGSLTVSYTPTEDLMVRLAFFSTWGSASATAQVIYNSIQLEFGSSKTAYEPFNGHSYPLNSSVILRGTLKLVSNELQYDGDIYYPDGKVERAYNKYTATTCTSVGTTTAFGNYAVVTILSDADAGSGVYTPLVCSKYLGVAASGDRAPMTAYIVGGGLVIVNPAFTSLSTAQSIIAQQAPTIIYKKKTPTIETITPYQQTQMADANGTEKFVTTNTVPVGHCTTYPTNLRAAIDSLPVDTTDAARTATNYITNIDSGGIKVTGNSATANVQISNKVRVQADSTHFTDVESTGMKVYSGSASVPVAQFLATGSRVSYDATHYTEFAANSWTICGGTNSPTITASTYPNTATEATTGLAGLTISNSARTKQLIQLFTYKRTYTGSNPESANITLHAYDTGNEVIGLKTTRLDDGSTAGGVISIQGLGTTNASVDMMSSIGNLNGTQRAGGLIRVHYGTAAVSLAAQLRTFGQNSAPSLEFYNTSGTQQSWYGANLAYIYREAGYAGYAAHGKSTSHKYTFEWSTIGSYNYLCFFVDTTEVYRLQQQSYSDERVKKDIEPIRSDYKDAVGAVNITQFRYDFDNETLKDADGIMFGIIAQDLIEELDDKGIRYTDTPLVSDMGEDEESLYSVNYTQFLLARIAHDEDRIQKLEEQNKALEERLSVLEDIMLKNLIRDIDET